MLAKRLPAKVLSLALLATLLTPGVALAYNNGRGFYGPTNDVVVTNAGYLLIFFFPTFIFVMSMIQRHLDKRKEARKAAQKAYLGNGRWHGGW